MRHTAMLVACLAAACGAPLAMRDTGTHHSGSCTTDPCDVVSGNGSQTEEVVALAVGVALAGVIYIYHERI